MSARRSRLRGFALARLFRRRIIGLLFGAAGALLIASVALAPLSDGAQGVLGVATIAMFMVLNRMKGRGVTLALIMLSGAVSLRYLVWRVSDTLEFNGFLQAALGIGLALAELYAVLVMVLGYIQTAWPLNRKPVPMPDAIAEWPSVDVYIPTYNESLALVRSTVLAALAIDYPADKLRVYILDDGRRTEFRDFAAASGAGYIIRPDNKHAKAGNLNHAMQQTKGSLIAIFDCDHVPTRAFLQLTVGLMVRDARLALVQTPHHFYSPDPFQRNLVAGTKVPSEGNMFYGLIQDGNDFWDAAFFCGSCAVIRRAALQSVGGFAYQTVTEDAHTALRLQRQGWRTAYLKIPLAAGLATERLALHIGQRMRWARGMIQILRTDNPLLGPGLRLGQRLCYFNAMLHFLFALPRIVFLTSPLAYLLLDQHIIAAAPLGILAYAGPHIFHAIATNSRIQGNHRHSFWSEIYETVMAPFLVRLTLVTLLSPKRGKFNVTDKGGLLEVGYFDLRAVYPNLILAGILLFGLGLGLYRLAFTHPDRLGTQALLLNSLWATISLLIVAAALAVGRETRQVRKQARVRAVLPATVFLADGRLLQAKTRELSLGGSSLTIARPADLAQADEDTAIHLEVPIGAETVLLPARVHRWQGDLLQVAFRPQSIAEESRIVQAVFGRADAWADWDDFARDRVLSSLGSVLRSIAGLFRRRGRALNAAVPAPVAIAEPVAAVKPATLAKQTLVLQPRSARVAELTGAAAVLLLLLAAPALAQGTPGGVSVRTQLSAAESRVAPPPAQAAVKPAATPTLPPPPTLPTVPVMAPAAAPAAPPPAAPPPIETALPPPSAAPATTADPGGPGVRRLVFSLAQLGAPGPMTMRGTSEIQGVLFGLRSDEVVTAAELSVTGATSPALLPDSSNVTVTMNEQYVGTIPADRDHPAFGPLTMAVNPVFFQDNNRLNFRFAGRYTNDCNDPLSGLLWATVSDTSTLTLTLARLPAQRDLSRLPLPFFDRQEGQHLVLPFVLPDNPGNATLQAAATLSSWFGRLSGFRGAEFPVVPAPPAQGNAVMLLVGQDRPGGVALKPFAGPTIAEVASPSDPYSSLLVVGGRTEAEAVTAASALVVGSRTLSGEAAVVQGPDLPVRTPYDAPAMIPTDRPVRLGELVDARELQGVGYIPGTFRVPFRTFPDLYTWRRRPMQADIAFRAPPGPIVDVSASHLDVSLNGQFLRSFPLATPDPAWSKLIRPLGVDPTVTDGGVQIPAYSVFGKNELQFSFDARPLDRGSCSAIPGDIHMSVDPDSTIDLSRSYHFAAMPNLGFMVSAGFPFTRMADLSETAAVLPDRPTPVELSAFLGLIGYVGELTGTPALRLAVARVSDVGAVADRDLLLVGTLAHLGQAGGLLRASPLRVEGSRISVRLTSPPLATMQRVFGDRTSDSRQQLAARLSTAPGEDTAMMVAAASPMASGRSLVAFLGASPQALAALVDSLRDPVQATAIEGDFALLSGRTVTSYRVGSGYTVGTLPFWLWPEWLLRDQPFAMVGLLVAGCFMLCVAAYWGLRRRAAARLFRQRPIGGGAAR